MVGKLIILGSGTSTGVPTLGCDCAVCHSADPRDRRLRPSVLISAGGHNILIDTTPDFRYQAMRAGLRSIEAVLFTHSHADHIMGMDDIRPFNFNRSQPIPIYADAGVLEDLRRVFRYVFSGNEYASAIPRLTAHAMQGPMVIEGVRFEPLPVMHGNLPILGYRFGPNAYVTDFSSIPEATLQRLRGLDLLILDALRHRPHPTHSHLANSLALVERLQPRRALFTHICHELPHRETSALLPPGVELAYDGLEVGIRLDDAAEDGLA